MRLLQHVYGRVARGYRGGTEGFQLAALSDGLAGRGDVVDEMNRLSFFNFRGGDGHQARYSWFRPSDDYVAFGRSLLAVDRTGSSGSFAHHYVCETCEFLRSRLSPVDMLRALPFYSRESDLPDDRSLPEIEIDDSNRETDLPEPCPLALRLVDMFMAWSGPTIPMVILPEDDTWPVLKDIFRILPQLESSYLSFSTLFVAASDYAGRFRAVFVPDRQYVPTGSYLFTPIAPADIEAAQTRPAALTEFWRRQPSKGPSLLRLANVLRSETGDPAEMERIVPELLATGQPFRAGIESLQVPGLMEVLLSRADWLTQYWRVGAPLTYHQLAEPLWRSPEACVPTLLAATTDLREDAVRDAVLEGLGQRIADERLGLAMLELLQANGLLTRFYEVTAARLTTGSLCRLARRLRGQAYYRNHLHHAVARRILDSMARGSEVGRDFAWWLDEESIALSHEPFLRAAADLAAWAIEPKAPGSRLRDYTLTESQYATLLPAVWFVGSRRLSGDRLVRLLYREDYSGEFLSLLAQRFPDQDTADQEDLLLGCARECGPHKAVNADLLHAIEMSKDAGRLARYYRRILTELHRMPSESFPELRGIEESAKRSKWGFFR